MNQKGELANTKIPIHRVYRGNSEYILCGIQEQKFFFFYYLIPCFIIEFWFFSCFFTLNHLFFWNHQFKIPPWNFWVFTWKKSIFIIDISNDLQRKLSKMTLHFFCFIEMCISLNLYMLNFLIFWIQKIWKESILKCVFII